MPKRKCYIVLIICFYILLVVSCKNNESTNEKLEGENRFYNIESDIITDSYSKGFSYSFYYDLIKKCDIKLELIIKEKSKEIGKIGLNDVKEDYGDIDGTFGISVDRDKENNKMIFTIRLNETIKQVETNDLYADVIGTNGQLVDSGLIFEEGVAALSEKYDLKDDKEYDEDETEKYDWSIEFKVYGTEVIDDDELNRVNYIGG